MKNITCRILLLATLFYGNASAAIVTGETIQAWNLAMKQSRASLITGSQGVALLPASLEKEKRSAGGQPSISVSSPDGRSHPVPSGFIHNWVGTLFIPHAQAVDVLAVLQDYPAYKEVYAPAIVEAEVLSHSEDAFLYRLKFVQKGFGVKASLAGKFASRYAQINNKEGYSVTEAIELQELRNSDGGGDEPVPQEKARGFVERSFTIVRYHERQGGTEIQVETLTLSREIPGSIRWIAMPLIKKFAAQTLTATLTRLSDRVQKATTHEVITSGTELSRREPLLPPIRSSSPGFALPVASSFTVK